jgi:hypothetical protein|tara:strand:+ start:1668 stop:1811 length:144 start_codon:yes stop_codon:yes gene_type:complete
VVASVRYNVTRALLTAVCSVLFPLYEISDFDASTDVMVAVYDVPLER